MKKVFTFLCVLLVFICCVSAVELVDGRIKVVVNDKNTEIELYYMTNIANNRYSDLLDTHEPNTTYPSLFYNNEIYKLPISSDFRKTIRKDTSDKITIEYKSAFCNVIQTISIIKSSDSQLSNAVMMSFSIENLGGKDASIGLRYLLDTWTGESSGNHFTFSKKESVKTETILDGYYAEPWIRSAGANPMQLDLKAPASRPDVVICANWKRLNDEPWLLEVNPQRNFSLLPYSIKDSAIAVYYNAVPVRPGASRNINIVLGGQNDGFSSKGKQNSNEDLKTEQNIIEEKNASVVTDLVTVRTVLNMLNSSINGNKEISPEEMKEVEEILDKLEERRESY